MTEVLRPALEVPIHQKDWRSLQVVVFGAADHQSHLCRVHFGEHHKLFEIDSFLTAIINSTTSGENLDCKICYTSSKERVEILVTQQQCSTLTLELLTINAQLQAEQPKSVYDDSTFKLAKVVEVLSRPLQSTLGRAVMDYLSKW